MKKDKGSYRIRSVNNLLDVIEALSEVEEIGVTELALKLDLHKNNAFRLLVNLSDRGYAEQDPVTEKYRLTPRFNDLGAKISLQQGNRIRTLVNALSEVVSDSTTQEKVIS